MTQGRTPFDELSRTPESHFKLYFFAAVARALARLAESFGSDEAVDELFPHLALYRRELEGRAPRGLGPEGTRRWWADAISAWERDVTEHLPLRALGRGAGLDHDALALLACAGLVEEDSRFGVVFEAAQGSPGQRRPTEGLLGAWWGEPAGGASARASLRRLHELGIVRHANPDAPRAERALQVQPALWDVLCGETPAQVAPWASYRPPGELAELDKLILPERLKSQLAGVHALLRSGEARALVLRGPRRNGRHTLAGALARGLGLGLLEIDPLTAVGGEGGAAPRVDEERWRLAGPLAACLNALPVVAAELAPGETLSLPRVECTAAPLAVVLGRQGGLAGGGVERALTLNSDMPDRAARTAHWRDSLGGGVGRDLEEIGAAFRLTGGNCRRAARLARVYSALGGRAEVSVADVRAAARALGREALETLAARVEAEGDWGQLATGAETHAELRNLESRCRNRELLAGGVGGWFAGGLNGGVRALFCGPSGTGKTLAARLLAASLRKDLYRLDLSTVVNKYIGETEKNLDQVFSRAEELDVVLLLDEGDALLTQRTDVSNANDRYANLETNYLLQRLESYEGILVITTNAGDRIDAAFQRRMDVCVQFAPPEAAERWSIWQLHLPAWHGVSGELLEELAHRCELSGGQIRNAALHASALALEAGSALADAHVEAAVRREYRKAGGVCPLRLDAEAEPAFANRW